jgi:integrase/recombinase XerD
MRVGRDILVPMLTVFRRHIKSCKYRSRRFKGCTCPISVEGRLHGEYIRKSLEVRNWESAQKLVRDWEAGEKVRTVSVEKACERFITDAEARHLGAAQLGKYKLLTRELKAFFPQRLIGEVTLDDLRDYRASWELGPVTSGKKVERLRAFFKFCIESGWIKSNPAKLLKLPKVKPTPTLPFSNEEYEKILWATELYPDRPRGRRAQVRAMILLLRYSALRIGDAVSLETKRIKDGKLMLYTGKTGTPVWLPLPEFVVESLQRIAISDRYFWSGVGTLKSATTVWQRTIGKLFKMAGVKGHAHMFRDTMAVDLLNKGVSLENVAAILGNTVRICEKHYAPWVKSRQVALETEIEKAWKLGLEK